MQVNGGDTDVTTYFALRKASDGTAATGLTITNFDLQYTRSGAAPVAKVDATALAATDSAHADNKAIEVDATDQPGLYRVDWPDAAFAAGVRTVALTVKVATAFTEHLAVQIDAPVDVRKLLGTTAVGSGGLPEVTLGDVPHGGSSAVFTLQKVVAVATGANDDAVSLTGNGLGVGLRCQGGVNGDGIFAQGGATSGRGTQMKAQGNAHQGLLCTGGPTGGDAAFFQPAAGGDAIGLAGLIFGGDFNGSVESVGFVDAGGITAASIATAAITAAKLATDAIGAAQVGAGAVTKIQSGLALAAALDTVDSIVDTIVGRLTAARAGYLDNLNVGGNVASSVEVTAIQNNTRVVVIVPSAIERPDSGSTAYKFHLYIYDDVGNMEAPDSLPTVAAANEVGTDRSSNLGIVTLVATGHYSVTYTVASGHAIEQVHLEFTVVEGGNSRLYARIAQIVDTTAVDFTASDRSDLQAVKAVTDVLPDAGALTTIGTDTARLTAVRAAVLTDWIDAGRLDVLLDAVKTVTDALPDAGALTTIGTDTARLTAVRAAVLTDWIDAGRLDVLLDAIKTVTDALPNAGALTTIGTDAARLTAVRAAVLTDWIEAGRLDLLLDAIKAKSDLLSFTTGNVHALTKDIDTPALAKYVTQDTGETAAVAGSVGKIAQGAAGGNVTVENFTTPALAKFANTDTTESTAVAGSVAKLAQGSGSGATVLLSPISVTIENAQRRTSPIPITMEQAATKAVPLTMKDTNGDPVDMSGKTLRFVVYDESEPPTAVFKVEGGGIVVSGLSNEVVTISISAANSVNALPNHQWRLQEVGGAVFARGPFSIAPGSDDA